MTLSGLLVFKEGNQDPLVRILALALKLSLLVCFASLLACLDIPGDLWHAYLGFHGWHEDTVPGGLDSAP